MRRRMSTGFGVVSAFFGGGAWSGVMGLMSMCVSRNIGWVLEVYACFVGCVMCGISEHWLSIVGKPYAGHFEALVGYWVSCRLQQLQNIDWVKERNFAFQMIMAEIPETP